MRNPTYRIIGSLSVTLFVLSGHCFAMDSGDFIKQFQTTYKEQMAQMKPGVIAVARGSVNYRVGDLWDSSLTRLLEGSDVCFPGIKPRVQPDSIGAITLQNSKSVGVLLRLKRIFDAAGSEGDNSTVSVSFVEVVEETPVEGDLRRSYQANTCPLAKPLLENGEARSDSQLPIVIGRLYRGKRRILVAYGSQIEANAKLSELGALLAGVPIELQAGAKFGSDNSLAIIDRESVPLAFAPAFVPVLTTFLGDNAQGAKYVWRDYSPDTQKDLLNDLANALAQDWSWADQ